MEAIAIKNVTVEVKGVPQPNRAKGYEDDYYLVLTIPLPGGRAIYELQIAEAQADSMVHASTIAVKGLRE